MPKIEVHDAGKIILFGVIIASATLLLALDRISEGTWLTIAVGVVSYLTGNGLLAAKGKTGAGALRAIPDPLSDSEIAAMKKLAPIVHRVSELEERGE